MRILQRRHTDSKSWIIYADGTQPRLKCANEKKTDPKFLGAKPWRSGRCVCAFQNIISPKSTEKKILITKKYSKNILITDCDFVLSNKTSAICKTTDTKFKTRLEADFKWEYYKDATLTAKAELSMQMEHIPGSNAWTKKKRIRKI